MSIMDGIMVFLFILFMIFIFGGYHKNKSAKREADFEAEAKMDKEVDSKIID